MIPTVFASAFTVFQKIAPEHGNADHRIDRDRWRPRSAPLSGLSHRSGVVALAVFINVIPGIAVTAAALALIDFDKPDYSLLDHFDWWGLIAMAGFLGALEYVLEEGPRNDWLQDDAIAYAAILSALSAVAFSIAPSRRACRSSICAPSATVILRSAACFRSCSESGFTG